MSFGEGNLRERVEDLEEIVFVLTEENKQLKNGNEQLKHENEQLKDFAAHMYKHIQGLSDALFMARGQQVFVNAEQVARLKTDEMRFRLSAKAFGIEVEP